MIQALLELFGGIFAFAGHITGGSSFPEPLSPEEEKDCIARLEAGDAEARRLLIEHNLRLVAHIAKKYTTPKRDADDVISIGVVGLIKAVSTFNSQKGNTLATYAARCIENEILMSLRSEKKQAGEVSLSEPIGMDKDGNEISLSEVLGSDEDEIHNAVELTVAGEVPQKGNGYGADATGAQGDRAALRPDGRQDSDTEGDSQATRNIAQLYFKNREKSAAQAE